MSIKQRNACAARMTAARRQQFLDAWEEASAAGKRAWAIYYLDTGLAPKLPGRPKTRPEPPPPPPQINNAQLFERFAVWFADLKFTLTAVCATGLRTKVFDPLVVSRDRVREMMEWARENERIVETDAYAPRSRHKLWHIK